jgi:hypothetical protein
MQPMTTTDFTKLDGYAAEGATLQQECGQLIDTIILRLGQLMSDTKMALDPEFRKRARANNDAALLTLTP